MKEIAFTLDGYAHEFHPFIEDLSAKERRVQEYAHMGNMNQIMSIYSSIGHSLIVIAENSNKLDNDRSLLNDLVAKVVQMGGEYIQSLLFLQRE